MNMDAMKEEWDAPLLPVTYIVRRQGEARPQRKQPKGTSLGLECSSHVPVSSSLPMPKTKPVWAQTLMAQCSGWNESAQCMEPFRTTTFTRKTTTFTRMAHNKCAAAFLGTDWLLGMCSTVRSWHMVNTWWIWPDMAMEDLEFWHPRVKPARPVTSAINHVEDQITWHSPQLWP